MVQGLDTPDDVMAPKVVEALLGTRFQGAGLCEKPSGEPSWDSRP